MRSPSASRSKTSSRRRPRDHQDPRVHRPVAVVDPDHRRDRVRAVFAECRRPAWTPNAGASARFSTFMVRCRACWSRSKHDQHYYALTGLAPVRERIEQHKRSIADYLSHLSADRRRSRTGGSGAATQDHRRSLDRRNGRNRRACRARRRRRPCSRRAKPILRRSIP